MVKTEFIIEKLNELFTREYNSVTQYVLESNPYCKEEEKPVLEELEKICEDERAHARRIAEIITRLEGLPLAGNFPYSIADINYLSISYCIDCLIQSKQQIVSLYEDSTNYAKGFPEIRRHLFEMLEEDKKHLRTLRDLKAKLTRSADQAS